MKRSGQTSGLGLFHLPGQPILLPGVSLRTRNKNGDPMTLSMMGDDPFHVFRVLWETPLGTVLSHSRKLAAGGPPKCSPRAPRARAIAAVDEAVEDGGGPPAERNEKRSGFNPLPP